MGQSRPARIRGDWMTSFAIGKARARLEQLWSTISTRGLSGASSQRVSVLTGKAFFVPPKTWKRLYILYEMRMGGGTIVTVSLQKDGLIAGLSLMKGG